jgi:hypothetical protein
VAAGATSRCPSTGPCKRDPSSSSSRRRAARPRRAAPESSASRGGCAVSSFASPAGSVFAGLASGGGASVGLLQAKRRRAVVSMAAAVTSRSCGRENRLRPDESGLPRSRLGRRHRRDVPQPRVARRAPPHGATGAATACGRSRTSRTAPSRGSTRLVRPARGGPLARRRLRARRAFQALDKGTHWVMGLALAREGYLTAIPDYRLAPAHPYPAGLVDTLDAIAFVHDAAKALGGRSDRLALAGRVGGRLLRGALRRSPRPIHPRRTSRSPSARAAFAISPCSRGAACTSSFARTVGRRSRPRASRRRGSARSKGT